MPVQIIPRNQQPSFAESLVGGLVEGSKNAINDYNQSKREREKRLHELKLEEMKKQQDLQRALQVEQLKGNIQKENFGEKFKQQYGAKYEAQKKMMQELGLDQPYDYQGQGQQQSLNNTDQQLADNLLGFDEEKPRQKSQNKQQRPLIPQSKIDKMGQINPQEASRMQRYNDSVREEMRHDESLSQQKEKFDYQKKKESPEYIRDIELTKYQAQADQKYYNELKERRSKQILKKESLGRLENLTKKKQTGKAYEKVLEGMGLVSLTSEGRREYSAEAKNQFTDFKAIAGSQLSASEFMILAGAYPNADFSPEANKAIINNLKQVHDTLDKEDEIAERLIKQNGGKKPENFQAKVNDELQKYTNEKMSKVKDNIKTIMNEQYGIPKGFTLMFDKNGEPLSVPEGEVVQLLESNLADLP